jgi:hypothetical protein
VKPVNAATFFTLMLFAFAGQAQSVNQNRMFLGDSENIEKVSHGGMYYVTHQPKPGIEGTPYLFEWKKSVIITKTKGTFTGYAVSYDASNDIFEVKLPTKVAIIAKDNALKISVGDTSFVSRAEGFFQLIADGKYALLKKYKASIHKSNYNKALDTGSKADWWDIDTDYYILFNDVLTKVKLSKKSVLKALEIRNAPKTDLPGFDNEAGAMLFFQKLNSVN